MVTPPSVVKNPEPVYIPVVSPIQPGKTNSIIIEKVQ